MKIKFLGGSEKEIANLSGANLTGANLTGANLRSANLRSANLRSANLEKAVLPAFQIVPEKGCFRAFKKVLSAQGLIVIELEISAKAQRTSSLIGRKCRASKARVVRGIPAGVEACSSHDPSFKYVAGGEVEVADFDPDIRIECTRGIHFFITRAEAEAY